MTFNFWPSIFFGDERVYLPGGGVRVADFATAAFHRVLRMRRKKEMEEKAYTILADPQARYEKIVFKKILETAENLYKLAFNDFSNSEGKNARN